ncbi:ABC transporter [Fragilaria crotonensis]|nr:ABC transporter [Fragilaria crotonensis]
MAGTVASSTHRTDITESILRKGDAIGTDGDTEDEEKSDFEADIKEEMMSSVSLKRAWGMAAPDAVCLVLGSVSAVLAGGAFPAWGIMFAKTIHLLYKIVPTCDEALTFSPMFVVFESCQAFFDDVAAEMRETSFQLGGYWIVVAAGCLFANMLTFWGFGMASEKRVRDTSFAALVCQEVAFFDKRSVGSITSLLQDDAARLHTFSGEPIRTLLIAFSSIVTGVVMSFVFMWPFALLAIGCIPLMGFATSIEMKQIQRQLGAGRAQ